MTQTRTKKSRAVVATAAAFTLALSAAFAEPAEASGLLVADGGFGGVLEIEDHDVEVTINNGIAVTSVTQVFRNTEDRQVEALYTFPVPKGASVADFSMWINGREMVGDVVEKRRAREIYESYKAQRIDPGLLEQVDYKTFEMRIFPIAANAEQRVRIVYYQELDFDNDWATYVYPLATETRADIDSRAHGRFSLSFSAKSEVPIVAVESPSHTDDFAIAKHTTHYTQASLEATGADLDRDVVLSFQVDRPRTGVDLIASNEEGEDGYFLLTMTAGDELGAAQGGMDYVFVLDVSGSMKNDGKLQLSRGSIDAFVNALGDDDRFEVLTFNVAANPLFSSLRAANDSTKIDAAEFLRQQRARGGTSLGPAIRAAYRYKDPDRQLNVVLLSDGMTEEQERQALLRLIGERPNATRVFAIGIGNDVNRPLLEQITSDAGGLAAFVSRGDDFERNAAAFRRKLLRPAVTDLRIEPEGGGIYDVEPRRLPNLYHGMPVRLYGRYEDSGPVKLKLSGDLDGERFEKVIEIELPDDGTENPEIERMWAWHRVVRLMKDADRSGSRDDVAAEIVRLGEGYSIVTPYTSFLVLENDGEYQRWKIERRNASRVVRDRAAQQRVRDQLTALRDRSAERIGPMSDAPETRTAANDTARRTSSAPTQTMPVNNSRGWDIDVSSSSSSSSNGGGAVGPFGLGLAAAAAGIALMARRRREDEE